MKNGSVPNECHPCERRLKTRKGTQRRARYMGKVNEKEVESFTRVSTFHTFKKKGKSEIKRQLRNSVQNSDIRKLRQLEIEKLCCRKQYFITSLEITISLENYAQ